VGLAVARRRPSDPAPRLWVRLDALAVEPCEDQDGGLLARAPPLAAGELAEPIGGLGGDGDRDRVHHDRSVGHVVADETGPETRLLSGLLFGRPDETPQAGWWHATQRTRP
jgi:hypothetical protein